MYAYISRVRSKLVIEFQTHQEKVWFEGLLPASEDSGNPTKRVEFVAEFDSRTNSVEFEVKVQQ